MSKLEPVISKYMTTQPQSIAPDATVEEACMLMKKKGIRHLPVVKGEKVVGLLSDRDVKLISGFEEVDAAEIRVADVCASNPYVVKPDAELGDVAATMASKHYGSAVVVDNGKLVGIFTTVDACRALTDVLGKRYHR